MARGPGNLLKLSKLTDYAVVVLSQMAQRPGERVSAAELAQATLLPEPTVAKILKALARHDVLASQRGAQGGYTLARRAEAISVADIVTALDGPVALTACVDGQEGACSVETLCPMRGGWDQVNRAVKEALEGVSLADIAILPPGPAHRADRLARHAAQ